MLTLMILLMALALAGAGMLFVGVRGLLARRVTIYSGKWLLALVALCFLPQFMNGLKLLGTMPSLAVINLIMYPGLVLVFWFITKGYIFFGVSEELVNEALKGAFGKLGLKHEQMLGSVKLEDGGIFQISIQEWVGTMQLKPKNPAAKARTKELVSALSEHFSSSTARIRFMPYWIYTFCGGLLLATLLFFASMVVNHLGHRPAPPAEQKQAAAAVLPGGSAVPFPA